MSVISFRKLDIHIMFFNNIFKINIKPPFLFLLCDMRNNSDHRFFIHLIEDHQFQTTNSYSSLAMTQCEFLSFTLTYSFFKITFSIPFRDSYCQCDTHSRLTMVSLLISL
ncbi:hypothetical protein AOX56_21560 [Aeromonas sobria]|uniref:Uncharacterized protein n=1 Tax=Aeromonas sobria TaxID=646 RepID=A0A2N3IPP9_AERSO|nr:hypothetical protein AOX56_21560 [Aeromonas sobria]